MYSTRVGVDLAKNVIQVCVVKRNKVLSNTEMTPEQFMLWLMNAKPATIVFEACGTSNYWKQTALKVGHDARLISAKLVATIRQNQKTDKNDALAIIQASQLNSIHFINGKSTTQQELQSVMRMRELAVKQKVALNNQIKALLLEFNIRIFAKDGGISRTVQRVLEDAENGFCMEFRCALDIAWNSFLSLVKNVDKYDDLLGELVESHTDCKKIMALEGVGVINAVGLYIKLCSEEDGTFGTGRDASACIGLTPIQYSSGGKVKLGSISKTVRDSSMRSNLVTGAMSFIQHVVKREPKTTKELWVQRLVERRGKRCAAVALANKTVRTAFAMLAKGTEYQAQPLTG